MKADGSFNNGKAIVTKILDAFGEMANVEWKKYFRTFQQILD
jgi:hypothetical protein